MAKLDHLVVRAESLAEGVAHVEAALGVKMAAGGAHIGYGTHNRLLSLGPELYLEVIAPNPAEPAPPNPRMFDMDRFSGPPALGAWVLRSKSVSDDIGQAPPGMGEILTLSRGEFRWKFSFPPKGRLPFAGAFPALIEWQGAHPAPLLPDSGYRLQRLEITHPEAPALAAALAPLLEDGGVEIGPAPEFSMRAILRSGEGFRQLG